MKIGEFDLYETELEKLLASEFVESFEIQDEQEPPYYISHHHVVRPESESTPVRIVWHSARRNNFGFSMNDALHKGPDLLNQFFKCIICFRENPIAFLGLTWLAFGKKTGNSIGSCGGTKTVLMLKPINGKDLASSPM